MPRIALPLKGHPNRFWHRTKQAPDRGHRRFSLVVAALAAYLLVLESLTCPWGFSANVSLTHGPIVGAVRATSAKIWVRTNVPTSVQVEYGTSPEFEDALLSAAVLTSQKQDMTGKVYLSGLIPETKYFYRLRGNGIVLPGVYKFSTSPPNSSMKTFSFAVLSDFRNSAAPVYASVAPDDPAFVIFLGDFSHRNPSALFEMRAMHREMRGRESPAGRDFIAYIRRFPFYHVWDDHDMGKNNADKTFSAKQDALRAFREYFPTPALPSTVGIWHKFQYAQAEFFMLDLRSQRDPNKKSDGPDKSILGTEQKQWLKSSLASSTARWKFLMSTVPFNPTSKPDDSWGAFQTERAEIVDFILRNEITGVIVVSGDLHSGGALDDGTYSTFPELSVPHANIPPCDTYTSCQCHTAGGSSGIWSEGMMCGLDNPGYGYISIDLDSVTVQVKGVDGIVRSSLVLR